MPRSCDGSARMRVAEALRIAGTLSFPSKMPGTSFSIPASACITGSKLAAIKQTVCSTCYALKRVYTWGNVQKALHRRLVGLSHPRWIEAMVTLLLHYHSMPRIRVDLGLTKIKPKALAKNGGRYRWNETGYHRWFDSGDLQSVEHLAAICEVVKQTPKIKHWLATQELSIVRRYVDAGGAVPDNLVIRVSSVMIDDRTRRAWPHTSSVVAFQEVTGHSCPAPTQDNQCKSCRACWSRDVSHVTYHLH